MNKKISFLIAVMILGLITVSSLQAGLSDVRLTVKKTAEQTERGKVGGEGSKSAGESKVNYDIKLESSSFKDLADLTVDYIVFVERQRLSSKKSEDTEERIQGTKAIPVLTKKDPQTVTTKDINLTKSNLVGNYIYSNGGRTKAEDSVKGVWVRVTQDGKILAEYANPSTVKNRGWEAK